MHGILIGGKTAYGTAANKWLVKNLAVGEVGVYNTTGALVLGNAVLPAALNEFEIYVGSAGVETQRSPVINRHTMKVSRQVYVAPVAKVMVVGDNTNTIGGVSPSLNLPNPVIGGSTAEITITDLSKPFEDKKKDKVYSIVCTSAESKASILARLAAKVNADVNRIVTAAVLDNNTGLSFTSRLAGREFTVICGGILGNADVLAKGLGANDLDVIFSSITGFNLGNNGAGAAAVTVLANNVGAGTAAWVAKQESDFATEKGDIKSFLYSDLLYTEPSLAANVAYDVYLFEWQAANDNILMPKNNFVQMLYLAVPNDAAQLASLNTIFGL